MNFRNDTALLYRKTNVLLASRSTNSPLFRCQGCSKEPFERSDRQTISLPVSDPSLEPFLAQYLGPDNSTTVTAAIVSFSGIGTVKRYKVEKDDLQLILQSSQCPQPRDVREQGLLPDFYLGLTPIGDSPAACFSRHVGARARETPGGSLPVLILKSGDHG